MTPKHNVLFGLALEPGAHQVSEMLGHARLADDAGLDVVSLSDHPYFAERVDAYARWGSFWAQPATSPEWSSAQTC